ncbi:MAG: ATP-binding protein, partial [Candidatus Hodarchaeota archaeon]
MPRTLDKLITLGQKQYLFYHLFPLADEIQQLSYEIVILKYAVKIRFYISINGNFIEEELIDKLKEQSDLVETAFRSSFKDIGFKNLVGQELFDAWSEIVEYGNYSFKRFKNDVIEINRTTNNLYLSILLLDSIAPSNADSTLTQIDKLINNILSHNISVHYISVIDPSSKYKFLKDLGKYYDDSNLTQKTLDQFSLEDRLHHQLLNVRHSEYIQMWNSSTYIVLKALDPEILRRHIQKIKTIFKQVFSNSMITGNVKILEKKDLENALPKVIMRDRINNIKMSSEQVISTFHLPESVVPSISIKKDIPLFEIPPKLENHDKRKIKIGTIYHGDTLLYNSYIDLEELRLNMFIVGQVGMGKTEFTKNLLKELYKTAPNINWLVLEWKGDYKDLITRINEPVQVINAGSEENPLKLNIFDPNRANPENHAMKIFSIIKEIFKSSYKSHSYLANYELSPQMEKITRDILIECVRNPDKRSFKAFFNELKDYENKYFGREKSSISMSVTAIENRFQRFTTGVLGKILNTEKSNVNFQDIMNRKIIFDLSSIIFKEGTKEDVRLLINLILKYVIDQALRRGPTAELRHIVILEDSQLLVPEVLREVPETTLGEDIPLLLRSVGEAMISIATRPQISPDIISNSAIKVTFKLNQADDTIKVAKYQNLNEEQEQYLRLTKKQEAIVTTLNFPYPFRIKTITSYPKSITNESIIKHNKKFFPEMYEHEKEKIIVNEIRNKIENSKKIA